MMKRYRMMSWTRDERGAALGLVIASALVCSIASYYILRLAASQSLQSNFFQGRAESRYLAEAALVVMTQKLAADPNTCTSPGGDLIQVDTNGDGLLDANDAPAVRVTITNCGAGNKHVLIAKASYSTN